MFWVMAGLRPSYRTAIPLARRPPLAMLTFRLPPPLGDQLGDRVAALGGISDVERLRLLNAPALGAQPQLAAADDLDQHLGTRLDAGRLARLDRDHQAALMI